MAVIEADITDGSVVVVGCGEDSGRRQAVLRRRRSSCLEPTGDVAVAAAEAEAAFMVPAPPMRLQWRPMPFPWWNRPNASTSCSDRR